MKRTERHQLKENELAEMLAHAREALGPRKGQVLLITVIVVVAAAALVGVTAWRQRGNVQAEQALAEAMVIFNAPVVPISAEPGAPGEVPAAATIGATGSYATEAAKLAGTEDLVLQLTIDALTSTTTTGLDPASTIEKPHEHGVLMVRPA